MSQALVSSRLPGAVLLVDDDPLLLRAYFRMLERSGLPVEAFSTGEAALARLEQGGVDVVVSDISLPGMTGLDLLREIRKREPDLPVLLMTGSPALESAAEAIDYGVLKYLVKPVDADALRDSIGRARQLYRMACLKREALTLVGRSPDMTDRGDLQASFERALESIWMAFQPLVRATDGSLFGYEALLRSSEPTLPSPDKVLKAAERLGELPRLGRTVRDRASSPLKSSAGDWALFVNLHPEDIADPELGSARCVLTPIADRVVLEVTERATLESVENLRERIAALRELGFRIAIDDLGAGYSGLTSFALLEPEIVKLDMALIRDIDTSPVKQKVVGSMAALCRDMGKLVVAEGVETRAEKDALIALGCDLLQGYLFARPGRPFPVPSW